MSFFFIRVLSSHIRSLTFIYFSPQSDKSNDNSLWTLTQLNIPFLQIKPSTETSDMFLVPQPETKTIPESLEWYCRLPLLSHTYGVPLSSSLSIFSPSKVRENLLI